MPKRKTIVVPCIEKIWLYASGERRPMPGLMSCVRMSIAKTTAMRKNTSAVPMYMQADALVVGGREPRAEAAALGVRGGASGSRRRLDRPGGTTTSLT